VLIEFYDVPAAPQAQQLLRSDHGPPASFCHARKTSATVHAWAMQPRGAEWGVAIEDFAEGAEAARVNLTT